MRGCRVLIRRRPGEPKPGHGNQQEADVKPQVLFPRQSADDRSTPAGSLGIPAKDAKKNKEREGEHEKRRKGKAQSERVMDDTKFRLARIVGAHASSRRILRPGDQHGGSHLQ